MNLTAQQRTEFSSLASKAVRGAASKTDFQRLLELVSEGAGADSQKSIASEQASAQRTSHLTDEIARLKAQLDASVKAKVAAEANRVSLEEELATRRLDISRDLAGIRLARSLWSMTVGIWVGICLYLAIRYVNPKFTSTSNYTAGEVKLIVTFLAILVGSLVPDLGILNTIAGFGAGHRLSHRIVGLTYTVSLAIALYVTMPRVSSSFDHWIDSRYHCRPYSEYDIYQQAPQPTTTRASTLPTH